MERENFISKDIMHVMAYFKSKLNLPLSVIQIQSAYLIHQRKKRKKKKKMSSFILDFIWEYLSREPVKGRISIQYSLLIGSEHKLSYMEHWERDLNTQWDLLEWQDIANNVLTISINTALLNPVTKCYYDGNTINVSQTFIDWNLGVTLTVYTQ